MKSAFGVASILSAEAPLSESGKVLMIAGLQNDGDSLPRAREEHSRDGERRILGDNQVWCVDEVPAEGAINPSPSLIFANTKIVRRVKHYPANWRDLPDAELYAISRGQELRRWGHRAGLLF